jgi:hypothetical protein
LALKIAFEPLKHWRQSAVLTAREHVGVTGRDEECDLKWEKSPSTVCVFLRTEVCLMMKNIKMELCTWRAP